MLHAVNDGVAEVASGIPTRPLFGRAWFEEEISGLRLRVLRRLFLQTNTEMADVLYQDAIEQAGLTGGEIVWDMYCGTGSIGLALAGSARRVIGVEIVAEAIERARENRSRTASRTCSSCARDAGKAPRDLIADGLPAPDVVVLDPPRAGMTPKAARRVAELGAPPHRLRLVQPDHAGRQCADPRRERVCAHAPAPVRPLPAHAARRVRRALRPRGLTAATAPLSEHACGM